VSGSLVVSTMVVFIVEFADGQCACVSAAGHDLLCGFVFQRDHLMQRAYLVMVISSRWFVSQLDVRVC
jgi:hypothetical protein